MGTPLPVLNEIAVSPAASGYLLQDDVSHKSAQRKVRKRTIRPHKVRTDGAFFGSNCLNARRIVASTMKRILHMRQSFSVASVILSSDADVQPIG